MATKKKSPEDIGIKTREVGIYKRKQESNKENTLLTKKKRKKKTTTVKKKRKKRKPALDQESKILEKR